MEISRRKFVQLSTIAGGFMLFPKRVIRLADEAMADAGPFPFFTGTPVESLDDILEIAEEVSLEPGTNWFGSPARILAGPLLLNSFSVSDCEGIASVRRQGSQNPIIRIGLRAGFYGSWCPDIPDARILVPRGQAIEIEAPEDAATWCVYERTGNFRPQASSAPSVQLEDRMPGDGRRRIKLED